MYGNYIIISNVKRNWIAKIIAMKMEANLKFFTIILIILTNTQENEKPYYGQSHNINERERMYGHKLKESSTNQQKKLKNVCNCNDMVILGVSDIFKTEQMSLLVEQILILFTGIDNTLNGQITDSKVTRKVMGNIQHDENARMAIYLLSTFIYKITVTNKLFNKNILVIK